MKTSIALLALILSFQAFSQDSKGGGGGDASEARVNDIRSDILLWINKGGSGGLEFPNGITLEEYNQKMSKILQPKEVVVTFVEKDDSNEEELQVSVDGRPKTCRGFFSRKTSKPNILCNIARFKATSESEQYKLIHHEFAGLAQLEKNDGAASDYEISNQITDYLEETKVLKLAVKQISSSVKKDCTNAYRIKAERRANFNYRVSQAALVTGTVVAVTGSGLAGGVLLAGATSGLEVSYAVIVSLTGSSWGYMGVSFFDFIQKTDKNNFYVVLRAIEAAKQNKISLEMLTILNEKLQLYNYSDEDKEHVISKVIENIKTGNSKATFCPATKRGVKVMNLRNMLEVVLGDFN